MGARAGGAWVRIVVVMCFVPWVATPAAAAPDAAGLEWATSFDGDAWRVYAINALPLNLSVAIVTGQDEDQVVGVRLFDSNGNEWIAHRAALVGGRPIVSSSAGGATIEAGTPAAISGTSIGSASVPCARQLSILVGSGTFGFRTVVDASCARDGPGFMLISSASDGPGTAVVRIEGEAPLDPRLLDAGASIVYRNVHSFASDGRVWVATDFFEETTTGFDATFQFSAAFSAVYEFDAEPRAGDLRFETTRDGVATGCGSRPCRGPAGTYDFRVAGTGAMGSPAFVVIADVRLPWPSG